MNKIKLIKSFTGYPVWEYKSDWNDYYLNVNDNTFIHKDVVELFKDHFEEVKQRPTSWEELWEVSWYWVSADASVGIIYNKTANEDDRNIFKTSEQAEAAVALAQITQLLDWYDIPKKSNTWYWKENNVTIGWWDRNKSERKWLLYFDTEEKLEHFYKHHKALIDKLAPFYIF